MTTLHKIVYTTSIFFCFLILLNCAGGKGKKISSGDSVQKEITAMAQGETLFEANCASCHALEDAGIGPRLGGITSVMSEEQLLAFIQNPAKVIEAGDVRAKALFEKYKMMMPAFDYLKPEEIRSIITYIAGETKARNIQPLAVKATEQDTEVIRYAPMIQPSKLRIELEEFVTLPASSETLPHTRIATMRAHPSGDGTLFVSDQNGLIYRIISGKINTFLDVRPMIENFTATPGLGTGLGSFAFHPDYLNNGLIYITHTEKPAGKPADYFYADSIKIALQWVVSEWQMKDIKSPVFVGTRRELLRINVPHVVHGTQDISFVPGLKKDDPDYGMLYVGTGDGGTTISKHPELAHSLRSLLGTIIRINPLGTNSPNGKYGIPNDNPFYNNSDPKVRKEIWAYGFRNPHHLAWWESPQGKKLLVTEIGEKNVEEINVIEKGQDYGWNVREGDYAISYKKLDTLTPVPNEVAGPYIAPFAQYDHTDGNAIIGGYVYEGELKALNNKFIFGDIIRGRLWYLNLSQGLTDHTIYELFVQQNGAPVTMKELSPTPRLDLRITYDPFKKEMYLMTKGDGKVRKIVKAYHTP
jgi:glucose/arabinose dehydrogenase/mono/diheme cytochrome c family protein